MRSGAVALLAASLVAGAAAPGATAWPRVVPAVAPRPIVGFADQKPSMFDDQRFVDLGIRQARINLPWDVLQDPVTLRNVDAWMAAAKRGGVSPLLTVDRSRRRGRQAQNPTPAFLGSQVRRWRLRWPGQVRRLSSWNEGNISKRPELVATWWLAIRRACPGCTVLGADLVDRSNAVSWARRFVKAAKRSPAVWGLHNYVDTNTFTTRNTRAFLEGVKGRIWLTETGGVLRRANPSVRFSGVGSAHAAKATSFLLERIVPLDPERIERVYLYSWSTAPNDRSWDSGLIGPNGTARPALRVLRCYLGSCRATSTPPVMPVPPSGVVAPPPVP